METLAKARSFLQANGRDIEQAQFAYHFDSGTPADLLNVLARYQNDDGGFGHTLEPDIKAPVSNPFATELALLTCLQADLPRDADLLQRTVSYLEREQDDDGGWHFSPEVYQYELAPWFAGWQFPNLNPCCTTAGLLKELGLGSASLHERVAQLFARLANPADVANGDFYGVRPYAYYFLPEGDHPQREFYLAGLLWWLVRQQLAGTLPDGDHFSAYIRQPQTYTARLLPPAMLEERLTALAAEQEADGGWPTPYAPAWRGWTTMQNLLTLQAFGKL